LSNARLDQLILALTVPLSDLGTYAVAVTLTELSSVFAAAVQTVITTKGISEYNPESVAALGARAALLNAVAVSAVVIASPLILATLFGSDFSGATLIVILLGVGQLAAGPALILQAGLASRGFPQDQTRIQLVSMITSICLLFGLLPWLGVYAAAVASSTGYVAAYLYALRRCSRRFSLSQRAYLPTLSTGRELIREVGAKIAKGARASRRAGGPSENRLD
jgi:O-antigen/teichoic acid export membrane protein